MQSRWEYLVLGGPCGRLRGSSYLQGAVFIIVENGGKKFQFLREEIQVTESFGSVH
jgi:hypothetical protein